MFHLNFVEKIKTHTLCSITFSENVKKYGADRKATDNNITQRMRSACWIIKATNTLSEYVTVIAFQRRFLHERPSVLRFFCLVAM
jgi:hypothetical protein